MISCPNTSHPDFKTLSGVYGENRAYFLWNLYKVHIPKEVLSGKPEENYYELVVPKTARQASKRTRELASNKAEKELEARLYSWAAKYGISVEIVNNMKERLGVDAKGAAKIFDRLILLAEGKADIKTFTEEIAHFFIEMLPDSNPLKQRILSLAEQSDTYQRVVTQYGEKYKDNKEWLVKEAAGKLLGQAVKKEWQESNKTFIDKVIATAAKIFQYFKSFFSKVSKPDKTELKDLIKETYREAARNLLVPSADFFLRHGEKENLIYYELKEEEEKPKESSARLKKIIDNARDAIQHKLKIYASTPGNIAIREDFLQMLVSLSKVNNIEALVDFIGRAYNYTLKAEERLQAILSDAGDISREDKIRGLIQINAYISSYKDVATELGAYIKNQKWKAELPESLHDGDLIHQLIYISGTAAQIQDSYYDTGVDLMAETLWELSTEARDKGAISDEEKLTLEGLKELLREAREDETLVQAFTDETIGSKDAVLALFAKMVKRHMMESDEQSRQDAIDFETAFDEFILKTGVSRDFPKKTFKDILEVIKDKQYSSETEKWELVEQLSLIQEYDITKYNEALEAFSDKLKQLAKDKKIDTKHVGIQWAKWFVKNTQINPDWKAVVERRKSELGGNTLDFKEWLDRNTRPADPQFPYHEIIEIDGKSYYPLRELTIPSEDYKNKRWENLQKPGNEALKSFYDFVVKFYMDSQEAIPVHQRPGFIIQIRRKSTWERVQEGQSAKTIGKKTIEKSLKKVKEDEEIFGLRTETGEKYRTVPVYFTQKIDISDVSWDLASSMVRFRQMANNYKAMSSIHAEVILMQDIMNQRKVTETTSAGNPIYNAVSKAVGLKRTIHKTEQNNLKAHFDNFIASVYYGESHIDHGTIAGLDIAKSTDILIKYTSMLQLAGNLMQGTANVIIGEILIRAEAAAGTMYKASDYRHGKGLYLRSMSDFFNDFNKIAKKSISGQLIDTFDAMQGKFRDHLGQEVGASKARKLFGSNTLFFLQNAGEHEMQISSFFAALYAFKVKDKDGKPILKADGKEMTLWDAYQNVDERGSIYIDPRVANFNKEEFMNKIHALNKRLHGIYNNFDRPGAQRHAGGRLAMLFRNWLRPGWNRRWGRTRGRVFNYEANRWEEGNYKVFYRFIKNLVQQLSGKVGTDAANWNNLSDFEKGAIWATLWEIGALLTTIAVFQVLSRLGDDDEDEKKKGWTENFILYQARRLQTELLFYVHPGEAMKLIQSPTATMSAMNAIIKFANQLTNPGEVYKRTTGIHEIGDIKLWARFQGLIPIVAKMQQSRSPEESTKWLQSFVGFH